MKSFRVAKPCDGAGLHQELLDIGVPVRSVRTLMARPGETGMCGLVVTEDAALDADVLAAIVAHSVATPPSRTLTRTEMGGALTRLEGL